jgi:hypothetical protein
VIRRRIETVKAEREKLSQIFDQRFPDYVALSKPQPVSLQETQALLADDEALPAFPIHDHLLHRGTPRLRANCRLVQCSKRRSYSITSSAVASSVGGTVRLIIRAV